MNNSSFLKQCAQVYKTIHRQINDCTFPAPDEKKWIEWAFAVAMQAWLDIEKMATGYRFLNRQEEVIFYTILKPRFTGLIDFVTMLYKSHLFQPDDGREKSAYWKAELHNCRQFIFRCQKGCRYYEMQRPGTDCLGRLHNFQQPLIFGINITHGNWRVFPHSYLLTRLFALKKYKKFLQEKIGQAATPACIVC